MATKRQQDKVLSHDGGFRSAVIVDDGTLIYMQNRGFLWGRRPEGNYLLYYAVT